MAKTLRQRYAEGLEALGFAHDRAYRTGRYLVYHFPGSDKRWFVGAAGSLRIGKTVTAAHPAGEDTKEHVLTAKERRPAVFLAADALAAFAHFPGAMNLAHELRERDAGMATLPPGSLLAHVKAWLKAKEPV